MRLAPLLLTLGCVENTLNKADKDDPVFDSGTDPTPVDTATDSVVPTDEECNGVDDDLDGQVDEGFPDDDGNGRVDCLDETCPALDLGTPGTVPSVEACEGGTAVTVTDPWNVTIEYQYTSAGSGVIVMPAVGNLNDDDGNGRVDERDIPDIAFTTWTANTLVALDGATGAEIFEVSGFDGQGGVTIADVDSDGEPEVVAFQTGYRIAAVDATGSIEWSSASFSMMAYPQPAVADMDGDGDVEVVGDAGIVDGGSGATLGTISGMANSWRTPVIADLDQDGTSEIILANIVTDPDGNRLWSNSGTGSGNFAAVADIDGDPGGEVFFVSGSTCYVHDEDGTLLDSFPIPGSNPGPPSVADFDGDGEVEIAVPANTSISVFDVDGTMLWTQPINDTSGLAGCSGYDVDGDGAYEVLYADQDNFYMYDGATGVVLYSNPNHNSGTVWEYPVIADVDNDGSAEVVIASNGGAWQGVTVFGHNGDGWPKSGTTWGTHDFAVTNLNPDGSVPSPADPSWQVYNVFRARPQVDDPAGPDLLVSITDVCVMDCTYGPVRIGLQVTNQGSREVSAGVVVDVYAVDGAGPRLVTQVTLPDIPATTRLEGIEVALSPADVGEQGFEARIDEAGAENECDEDNNVDRWRDALCP